jgi:hypothetical protein
MALFKTRSAAVYGIDAHAYSGALNHRKNHRISRAARAGRHRGGPACLSMANCQIGLKTVVSDVLLRFPECANA